MSTTTALVPLRSPGRGKTRLAGSLSAAHRAALSAAMFADVVAALRAAPIDRIVVAAGGSEAAAAASALGVEVSPDPPSVTTLDAAIAASAAQLGPVRELLVVAADLPRLTSPDVDRLLATDAEVALAPTRGGGTGGLLRRPGTRIATSYGPGSAAQHRELALVAGASFASVAATGFWWDVDTHADLMDLDEGPLGPATATLLDSWADVVGSAG